jgi:hypothetical protein
VKWGSVGAKRRMIAAGRRVRVMPQMKVEQGITAARTMGAVVVKTSWRDNPALSDELRAEKNALLRLRPANANGIRCTDYVLRGCARRRGV